MSRKGQFNNERTFGVEIECLFPNGVNVRRQLELAGFVFGGQNGWRLMGDISVVSHLSSHSGNHEIVSPILKGQEGLDEVKRMYNKLEELDVRVNKTCGMHVHHDINDWKRQARRTFERGSLRIAVKKVRYLISLVARYEHVIYSVLPKSRLSGNYSMTINQSYKPEFWTNGHSFCTPAHGKRNNRIRSFLRNARGAMRRFQFNRFCGLNFHAFYRQGTVEFRYGAGTVNATKAVNWIVFTQLFVNTAEIRSDQNRRIRMNNDEPYKTTQDRKTALAHLKVVLGITRSGMDARQGIVRDESVKALDSYLTERQNLFASNWNQDGVSGNNYYLNGRSI